MRAVRPVQGVQTGQTSHDPGYSGAYSIPVLTSSATSRPARRLLRDCFPQTARHLTVEDAVINFCVADEQKVVVSVSVPSRHDGSEFLLMEQWEIVDGLAVELKVFYWDPFPILEAVRELRTEAAEPSS